MRRLDWIAGLLLLAAMPPAAGAASPAATGAETREKLARVPLSFEENHGQTNSAVKFLSHGDGYAMFLTAKELVFEFGKTAAPDAAPSVLRMKMAGTGGRAKISGSGQLAGTANYFIGNNPRQWHTGVPTYQRVNYRGVYPGVDAVFYGNQRALEYDFNVAPGADPGQIALDFSGAHPVLNRDGDLVLRVNGDAIILRRPVIYQGSGAARRTIDGNYLLSGNRVRFRIGLYNHRQLLVIDPVLYYLTYLGGNVSDTIGAVNGVYPTGESDPTQALAVDSLGNTYVTGYTLSLDFPLASPYQGTPKQLSGYGTGFVTKLNASGTALVYSTYLGGSVIDKATAIAVDANGSAYVVGYTSSPDFPTTPNSYMPTCPTEAPNLSYCQYESVSIGFLTKFSRDGSSLVYSTYLGTGAGNTFPVAVAVDSLGQAYMAGNTGAFCNSGNPSQPPCFPETPNAVLPESLYDRNFTPGAYNQGSAFVTVFDQTGATLLYSTLFGDSNTALHDTTSSAFIANATGVAVDALGNFYLVGSTEDDYLPTTPGAFQAAFPNSATCCYLTAGFVVKFSPVASSGGPALVYATYFGSPSGAGEQISSVAADSNGSAYIAGRTQAASGSFPASPGAYQTACTIGGTGNCVNTGFIAKLKPDGSGLVWATLLGGTGSFAVNSIGDIVVDAQDFVYVAGQSSAGFPLVNPVQTPAVGNGQAFVAKFDPTGSTIAFSSLLGSATAAGTQSAAGLAVDKLGNIYLAGNTSGGGLPVTPGGVQQAYTAIVNNNNGFLAAINPFAAPAVLSVSMTHSGYFLPGQQSAAYTITVSNASGAGSTVGVVQVTETVPQGFTSVAMVGTGWNCSNNGTSCTRTDPLPPGVSYPALTATVNVASNAPASLANQVTVAGGGSATASASDSTTVFYYSSCDVGQHGSPAVTATVADVQQLLNEALGIAPPVSDLSNDGVVSVADVQIVMNAVLNLGCVL